ncbi:MAG: hypothetical protein GY768_12645 [Planctomycetaceae bacterium]|nr:hypothetical protein [Planctomycetaceae bacterium]
MELRDLGPDGQQALEQTLGYLNFSSGAPDNQFLLNLNQLFAQVEDQLLSDSGTSQRRPKTEPVPTWRVVGALWREKLVELTGVVPAFEDTVQVNAVLNLLLDHVVPGVREFHRDLLFHQSDDALLTPFLIGRICEAVLRQGSPWDETDRITESAIRELNDYVGYRPVAVLESRVLEPYPHEKVRPIPLFIQGVGVAKGPYQEVVSLALKIISETDPMVLQAACFVPDHLEELALDPRAYDFEHPVNKRPNYHFGQWDPHSIDNRGFYNRFVIQQVTLDALMDRFGSASKIPNEELKFEAAAVLVGTILMASGVSGTGPESHDSSITLGNLLPRIATFRDVFYEQLIEKLEQHNPKHAERLVEESQRLRQPFGAARQHLNSQLTRQRASQLEHVRLASLFARMGYPEAAQRQIDSLPVTSARMLCRIDCNLTLSQRDIDDGNLARAEQWLDDTRDLLTRGIQCGAVIDPWNILGFDGNFSLFPAMENSIHDHRVDEMLELIDEVFETYGRLWSAAAASDDQGFAEQVNAKFNDFARWWHQFAVHEVSCVDAPDCLELHRASEDVVDALKHWHQAGEATGAIGFWAPYVERFDSPRAYAMVIEMLLDRRDVVAARALLIHWLGQADLTPLEQGEDSFHRLSMRWLLGVLGLKPKSGASIHVQGPAPPETWRRVQKFFDYMEANAGDYWHVPPFGLGGASEESDISETSDELLDAHEDQDDDEDDEDLFGAAYEDVVYRDSTDDGIEGSLFDTGGGNDDQLDVLHDQIAGRLSFLNSLARLRRIAALAWMLAPADGDDGGQWFEESLKHWLQHGVQIRDSLERLLSDVSRYRLGQPSHDYLSMAEFDRERMIKESLMEHVIGASVEISQTDQFIHCALRHSELDLPADQAAAIRLLRSAIRGQQAETEVAWSELKAALSTEPILYVPLVRGGNPRNIVEVRNRQQMLRVLLAWLPRLGLLTETRDLIDVVRTMERSTPAGPGAVTEFDDLFEVGFRSLVDCVIRATNVNETQDLSPTEGADDTGPQLVSCLESMTESMLVTWLSHSRTLRLSVLEKVKGDEAWQDLVQFVKRYGEDLFTQQFLSLANVRSILFQGVENWLLQMEEDSPEGWNLKLIEELDSGISREEATKHMTLVLEAVVENYGEYRDYNSTTTQSDRGDLIYNLLDFLRLLSKYERVVWNLKPVVLAHELLVRRGCNDAAQMWRRALSERIAEEADRYVKRLTKLQQRYAMQLPTIADRVNERFLRPLIIDRMRSLVEPAIEQRSEKSFAILEDESALLLKQPSGVGFEPPAWLLSLEEEVRRVRREAKLVDEQQLFESLLPAVDLTIEDVQDQIEAWSRHPDDD